MKYKQGNIVDLAQQGHFDVIIHGCNCQCTMNSGVAKAIRAAFPQVYEADCKTTKGDVDKLGSFTYATAANDNGLPFTIYNAYTQFRYGTDKQHFELQALISSIEKIKKHIFKDARIGIPKIGAGLGGGDWVEISGTLEQLFEEYDVTVVVLE